MSEDGGGRGLVWALIGCAGFLVLGVCITTGVGAFLVIRSASEGPGLSAFLDAGSPEPWLGNPGGNPVGDKPQPRRAGPLRLTADVTSVTGSTPVAVGDACAFEVEETRRDDGTTWCHTEITCGGRVVYGGGQSGYFSCVFSSAPPLVRGRDDHTTRDDQDPSMLIDTDAASLTLGDDETGALGAFGLEARITRVE